MGGGSQLDRLILELEDWITAGQVSAGAGAEARGDLISRKWKEGQFPISGPTDPHPCLKQIDRPSKKVKKTYS